MGLFSSRWDSLLSPELKQKAGQGLWVLCGGRVEAIQRKAQFQEDIRDLSPPPTNSAGRSKNSLREQEESYRILHSPSPAGAWLRGACRAPLRAEVADLLQELRWEGSRGLGSSGV